MSRAALLEIQNRTPFPMTWAHLERDDAAAGAAPRNLLADSLPPHRGRVVGEVASGPVRLVCGFAWDGERPSVVGPRFVLEAGGASSACVRHDPDRGFHLAYEDARARPQDGRGAPAGPYRWNGRRGRTHDKDGRQLRGGRR